MDASKLIHLIMSNDNLRIKTACGLVGVPGKEINAVSPTNSFKGPTCLKCRQVANGMKKKVSKFER